MGETLRNQAERLFAVFSELVRAYQFRDREDICCHGLSISQCYSLEAIVMDGPLTMGELATHLYLEISTMTRVVDHLVRSGFAKRVEDAKDRRVCRVAVTPKGRTLMKRIRGELVTGYEQVLHEVPAKSREDVIKAVSLLLTAFKGRQASCCDPERQESGVAERARAS